MGTDLILIRSVLDIAYRAEDVARILKVTPSAVFKWAKAGVIPSYRIHEKCLRFKREDISAFVEKGRGVGFTCKKNGQR